MAHCAFINYNVFRIPIHDQYSSHSKLYLIYTSITRILFQSKIFFVCFNAFPQATQTSMSLLNLIIRVSVKKGREEDGEVKVAMISWSHW